MLGYFARWAALRKMLYQFLDCEPSADGNGNIRKQILSLGAGFDTLFFQLQVLQFSLRIVLISSTIIENFTQAILSCLLYFFISFSFCKQPHGPTPASLGVGTKPS